MTPDDSTAPKVRHAAPHAARDAIQNPDAARMARRANLKRLLGARSLAFVGGAGAAAAIRYAKALGFAGPIWAVNPKQAELGGIPCVPRVADLPGVPDATFVGVAPATTVTVVEQLRAMGAPGAVCFAAGFAEIGDGSLQAALTAAAGPDMALVGPNCTGVVNYLDGVAAIVSDHGFERPARGVAIAAQSGTITTNMIGSARTIPVAYMLSIGNQAVLDMADYVDVALDDPRVTALVLYLEGLRDAEAFARAAAKALAKGVPIVALKAGLSAVGRQVALSHTGSLTGAAEAFDAFLDRLGIARASSYAELLELAKILGTGAVPKGNRLAIETCSGSDAGYCGDLAERHGIALPQPRAAVREKVRAVIPPLATPMNPLDVTMAIWNDRAAQATALLTLMEEPADAAALVINYPGAGIQTASYDPALEAMVDVKAACDAKGGDVPCFVMTNLPEGAPEPQRRMLAAHGIVTLQGLEDGFAALGTAIRNGARRAVIAAHGGPETRLVRPGVAGAGVALGEAPSKAWLARAGVAVPAGRLAATPAAAAEAAQALGFPVALKATGATLLHKSEKGGVALGLKDAAAVGAAAGRMAAAIPEAEGFLVEGMVVDGVAELIVGAKRDPVFGMALAIGAGGILAELLHDVQTLLLPTDEGEVRAALARLRAYPLLQGFRGRPRGDVDAAVAAILAIARAVEADADAVVELDVNPLIVRPEGQGAVAVDALLATVDGTI